MDSIEASDPSGFVPAIDEAEATADDMVEGAPLESMPLEGEAAELPAEDEPAEDLPAEELPAEETPAEEAPAEELPTEEVLPEEAPMEGVAVEEGEPDVEFADTSMAVVVTEEAAEDGSTTAIAVADADAEAVAVEPELPPPKIKGKTNKKLAPRVTAPKWTEQRIAECGRPVFRCNGYGGRCTVARPMTDGGKWAKHNLSPKDMMERGTDKRHCGQCKIPIEDQSTALNGYVMDVAEESGAPGEIPVAEAVSIANGETEGEAVEAVEVGEGEDIAGEAVTAVADGAEAEDVAYLPFEAGAEAEAGVEDAGVEEGVAVEEEEAEAGAELEAEHEVEPDGEPEPEQEQEQEAEQEAEPEAEPEAGPELEPELCSEMEPAEAEAEPEAEEEPDAKRQRLDDEEYAEEAAEEGMEVVGEGEVGGVEEAYDFADEPADEEPANEPADEPDVLLDPPSEHAEMQMHIDDV